MNGGAASNILYFLNTKKDILSSQDLLKNLSELTSTVLADTNDSSLLDALVKCGWNVNSQTYVADLNLKELGLKLLRIIERRSSNVVSRRTSELGIKNTIKSFAPDLLMMYMLQRTALNEDAVMSPFSVFFDGVCLLADISGFTRLSGKFCARGRDGIDQLQQATNGYLSKLVKKVYAYGGDVMKFAGDALVCVFQASNHKHGTRKLTLSDVCTNAVQCATELSQICTDELTIHVAVSCGPICLSMLGGHNDLWECLISGECLGHLSQCLDDASSKQTVVTPQFVEASGAIYRKELNIKMLSSGNYLVISAAEMTSTVAKKLILKRTAMLMKDSESRFSMFPNDDEFLRAVSRFVPAPVSMGLMSGSFDYLAELREVTTMFMSWDSYDEVVNNDLLTLQEYFTTAQEVLAESGGFIRQFLIDDKGCVLIACWGVPTASHPDNTRRALCAGAIIGYKLDALGMKTSVGITTGTVFCGSVGSYVRREYAVIGDVVNLAARLMCKAKGGLLIDDATYSGLPRFLRSHLDKLEPMALKGKDCPITTYCLSKSSKNISFLDRDDNDLLIDSLTKPAAYKSPILSGMKSTSNCSSVLRVIVIEGKIGTANMEITNWLKSTGEEMAVHTVSLRMTPKNATIDYSLIAGLFRLLIKEEKFDNPDQQKIVVNNLLRDVYKGDRETAGRVAYPAMRTALGVTCPLLDGDTSPLPTESSDRIPRLPPALLNQCLKDIFSYLFNKTQIVIAVEYAHHADMLSLNILVNLAGILSRALLVFTVKPVDDLLAPSCSIRQGKKEAFMTEKFSSVEKLSIIFKRLLKLETTILVRISDYSVCDVEDLLKSVLDRTRCPSGLALMVHQLSGGDPFWCREMALFLQTTGADEFMRAMNAEVSPSCSSPISCTELNSNSRESDSHSLYSRSKSIFKPLMTLHDYLRQSDPHPPTTQPLSSSGRSIDSEGKDVRKPCTVDGAIKKVSLRIINDERYGKNTVTTSKLELFIVCRFGKLSSEDQNLLRVASIIGQNFSREILFDILSPKMRTQMQKSLTSLVTKHWIVDNADDSMEYGFVHPLFHQTLYYLTPTGDRAKLHLAIACCIHELHDEDPDYYSQLAHHYSSSAGCRPKAFQFFVLASLSLLSRGPNYCEEGLKLLQRSKTFADSATDCDIALGIIAETKEKIEKVKKMLVEDETAPPLPSSYQLGKASKGFFKSFRNTKITPDCFPNNETDSGDAYGKKGNYTLNDIDLILKLFESAETEFSEYSSGRIDLGSPSRWQVPHFKRWAELINTDERSGKTNRRKSIWDTRADSGLHSQRGKRRSFMTMRSTTMKSGNTSLKQISEKSVPKRHTSSFISANISARYSSTQLLKEPSIKTINVFGCSIS